VEIEMVIKIICNCIACDGHGVFNDPGFETVCQECQGEGTEELLAPYDTIASAQRDYPNAVGFTYWRRA
tara:strand:+ start:312 stop:518 length:207 start_codon:yes stop_codon:yes gene_type:complete